MTIGNGASYQQLVCRTDKPVRCEQRDGANTFTANDLKYNIFDDEDNTYAGFPLSVECTEMPVPGELAFIEPM